MGLSTAASFAKLMTQLQGAGSGELAQRLMKNAAAEAITQTQMGFRESRAPDGTAWAPLAWRDGMPLRDTGRLGNSFAAYPTATGFRIGTNVTYAPPHQTGGKVRKVRGNRPSRGRVGHLPARPMLPTGGTLGPIWAPAIRAAVMDAFKKFWR